DQSCSKCGAGRRWRERYISRAQVGSMMSPEMIKKRYFEGWKGESKIKRKHEKMDRLPSKPPGTAICHTVSYLAIPGPRKTPNNGARKSGSGIYKPPLV